MHDLRLGTLALLLVAGACSNGAGGTAPPSTAAPLPTAPHTAIVELTVPDVLAAFPVRTITVDGDPWLVAVADTPTRRGQGLMNVTDLGSLDGMLFVFPETVTAAFWMKDTLIPLDIAFFDDAGRFVDKLTMRPCQADPCPTYPAAAPYRYALEAPEGGLAALRAGAVLDPGA